MSLRSFHTYHSTGISSMTGEFRETVTEAVDDLLDLPRSGGAYIRAMTGVSDIVWIASAHAGGFSIPPRTERTTDVEEAFAEIDAYYATLR